MKRIFLVLVLLICSSFVNAQISNEDLNKRIGEINSGQTSLAELYKSNSLSVEDMNKILRQWSIMDGEKDEFFMSFETIPPNLQSALAERLGYNANAFDFSQGTVKYVSDARGQRLINRNTELDVNVVSWQNTISARADGCFIINPGARPICSVGQRVVVETEASNIPAEKTRIEGQNIRIIDNEPVKITNLNNDEVLVVAPILQTTNQVPLLTVNRIGSYENYRLNENSFLTTLTSATVSDPKNDFIIGAEKIIIGQLGPENLANIGVLSSSQQFLDVLGERIASDLGRTAKQEGKEQGKFIGQQILSGIFPNLVDAPEEVRPTRISTTTGTTTIVARPIDYESPWRSENPRFRVGGSYSDGEIPFSLRTTWSANQGERQNLRLGVETSSSLTNIYDIQLPEKNSFLTADGIYNFLSQINLDDPAVRAQISYGVGGIARNPVRTTSEDGSVREISGDELSVSLNQAYIEGKLDGSYSLLYTLRGEGRTVQGGITGSTRGDAPSLTAGFTGGDRGWHAFGNVNFNPNKNDFQARTGFATTW